MGRAPQPQTVLRPVEQPQLAPLCTQSSPSSLQDRNRTAPFPFCGNRFEFRAVSSSQNCSFPVMPGHLARSELRALHLSCAPDVSSS